MQLSSKINSSEFKTTVTRGIGQCGNSPVISKPSAIKDDLYDPFFLCTLSKHLSNRSCHIHVATALAGTRDSTVHCAGGCQRVPRRIVDYLCVNVTMAAVDRQPRPAVSIPHHAISHAESTAFCTVSESFFILHGETLCE
jgi:hypothetical protein